jgi:hypothetical protein
MPSALFTTLHACTIRTFASFAAAAMEAMIFKISEVLFNDEAPEESGSHRNSGVVTVPHTARSPMPPGRKAK